MPDSAPFIFVVGGARSGKSRFAHRRAESFGEMVTFIATATPMDSEMEARIARHRADRPSGWRTLEAPHALARAVLEGTSDRPDAFLIDCITLWLTNRLMDGLPHEESDTLSGREKEIEERILAEIEDLAQSIRRSGVPSVVVSNEVGSGIVPMHPVSRLFRDLQGWANQRIAAEADEVYWTMAGIPVKIK
ncbi:MAG: bifunctional adenosylcobinamide kinase/adenosylcobinamide-phosphate guanylyltransferase [Armatimonadetes bacterium]|nr:bifunctional adenosylcobinamide kinase/adenosylcobinamide-phosphate guanylyltransferase [Armatimonadota bacterium]